MRICALSFVEIMDGAVMFADNPLLCYLSSIDWQSLFGGREANVIVANDPRKLHSKCQFPAFNAAIFAENLYSPNFGGKTTLTQGNQLRDKLNLNRTCLHVY